MTEIDIDTESGIRFRIALVKQVLKWLDSDDPIFQDRDEEVRIAKVGYTAQLASLESRLQAKQPAPVVVGLKTARVGLFTTGGHNG